MEPTFFIVNLPDLQPEEYSTNNPIVKKLAERFRSLRLFALKQSPEAYASSYEAEVQRDLDHTLGRLKTPQADHFIAVDSFVPPWTPEGRADFFQALFEAKWIGVIVNIGPVHGSKTITAKKDPLAPDGSTNLDDIWDLVYVELNYQPNALFVDPSYRGHGIAQALMQAIFDKSQTEADERGVHIQFTVFVDSENWAARKLYEKMGFRETQKETYVQIPREQAGELVSRDMVAVRMELMKASAPEVA